MDLCRSIRRPFESDEATTGCERSFGNESTHLLSPLPTVDARSGPSECALDLVTTPETFQLDLKLLMPGSRSPSPRLFF